MSIYFSQQDFDKQVPKHSDLQKSKDEDISKSIQQLDEQIASVELKELLLNFVHSHHYLMYMECKQIHYSEPTERILDFYCQSPENSQQVKQVLLNIMSHYSYNGFESIKKEIDNIECAKLIIQACQENIMNIPSKLQTSLLEYFDLCSYYKRIEPQKIKFSYDAYHYEKNKKELECQLSNIDDELLEIAILLLQRLDENYDQNTYFHTELKYFIRGLIVRLFDWDFDKLKNSNKIMLIVENFKLLTSNFGTRKELFNIVFIYIKSLYKKNLLTIEIIDKIEKNIDFNDFWHSKIPATKRKNMQQELDHIILDFKNKPYYSVDELEEINLKPVDLKYGKSSQAIFWNEYALFQQCTENQQCEIFIYDQNGQSINTEPKGFKAASEVKELKKQCKAISKIVAEQSQRFEQAMINQRQWTYPFWQNYLLGHGVLSWLAIQFIWQIHLKDQVIHGLYDGKQWINQYGEIIDIQLDEIQYLNLWHPVCATVAEVQAWQSLFIARNLTQCFKQVWREVYIPISTEIEHKNQYIAFAKTQVQCNLLFQYLESSHWTCQVTQLIFIKHYRRFSRASDYKEDDIIIQDDFKRPVRHFPIQHITVMLDMTMDDLNQVTLGAIYFCNNQKWKRIDIDDVPVFIFSETIRDIKKMIQSCTVTVGD